MNRSYTTNRAYKLISPHGGYRKLLSYQTAEIIYDLTVDFCRRYMSYKTNKTYTRTYDQMVQAARSGKQNIAEGCQVSGTSKKTELKLIGVARGSLEELLQDYEDFLRQRGLPVWGKDDPQAHAVRGLAYRTNRTHKTYTSFLRKPESAANMLLTLIHQANYLLDQQLRALEKDFLEKGGFTENLYKKRVAWREKRGRIRPMRPIGLIRLIQTGIILPLALGTPVVAVLDEKFWFEKRVALAGVAVVLLALLAAKTWRIGRIGPIGPMNRSLGWLLFGAALLVAAAVPAGRIGNLATPDLWVGLGAVVAYFAIKNTTTSSRQIKIGFWAAVAGVVVAAALVVAGPVPAPAIGRPQGSQLQEALQLLQRSPILGEFREFRTARLGALQIASGLGILGILGILALAYQLGLKSVKEILKSSGLWRKALNLLVLLLLVGFLILPHPALTLWPLAVAAALARGIGQIGPISPIGPIRRGIWAVLVGLLIVLVLGSSYGLGRVVWGEMKFREALAAANRNEGITTYYALREAIKRNPYEVRYHLLASQIDLALANSIAAQAAQERGSDDSELSSPPSELSSREPRSEAEEATPSAQLSAQDQNNIMILIQEAVIRGKRAVQLDPENSLLWQNLASIYRALVGVAGGAEDWAVKCCQRAIELNPQDPNPHLFIGEIHFLAGNFQGAADGFREAARLAPNFARARYNLAVAYNALGEIDKAIEELRETLTLLPTDSPDRAQVEKDLAFLKGEKEPGSDESGLSSPPSELSPGEPGSETEELKEATTGAEVEAPPPPVGPEATESGKIEVPEGLEE